MSDHSIRNVAEQKYEVTPLELFFDLVFAFAISQLSQHLLTHLSWRGAAETLVMLLAVFAAWFTTSWSATLVRADQSRTRWLVLAVMLLGLFMNASVTRAFTSSGWAFVIPMLLIQLGRAVWTLLNSTDAVLREHYFRTILWLIATTPLWIAGAANEPGSPACSGGRWLQGLIRSAGGWRIQFPGGGCIRRTSSLTQSTCWNVVACSCSSLLAKRSSPRARQSPRPLTVMTLATGTFALAGTVALWALSFGRSHRLILQHVEETSDPIRASRHAVNALMIMVAGLIAVAVANKEVIAHPYGQTSFASEPAACGRADSFLAAQGWYLWPVPNVRSRLHVIGGVALLICRPRHAGCSALYRIASCRRKCLDPRNT